MKTSIDLTDDDLKVIEEIRTWILENLGYNLNRSQIIKKSLYNENYFLYNVHHLHPEEIQEYMRSKEIEDLPWKTN